MKINNKTQTKNKLYWLYLACFFIILALPLLAYPPYFFPPDWGKAIIFRMVLSGLALLLIFQFLYRPYEDITVRKINWRSLSGFAAWLFVALFSIYILANIFSVEPYFSFWGSPARSEGTLNYLFFGIFSALAFFLLKERDWQRVWDFSFIIADLVALVGIFQYLKLFPQFLVSYETSAPSTVASSTFLAVYLLLLFFIVLSFGIKETGGKKIFYFSSLPLFIFGMFATGCRAAYLGLLIGGCYFLFFYPKKIKILKIAAGTALVLIILTVAYVNTAQKLPGFIENNSQISYFVHNRMSIKIVLEDLFQARLSAWKIGIESIKERPILGWGPENFQVGFDKNYDPALPQMPILWWDRAHNFLIDLPANAGVPFLTVYLLLIGTLFWEIEKIKKGGDREKILISHGIQAALIGYLTANFFGFDGFVTHLIFFLIIGYSFYLVSGQEKSSGISEFQNSRPGHSVKHIIFGLLLILLIWFLWSFNINPLRINGQIVVAEYLAKKQKCDAALTKMENLFPQKNILDVYLRLKYISFLKDCSPETAGNDLDSAKRGLAAGEEVIKKQPTYTRGWVFMGAFTNILIEREKDPQTIQKLTDNANYYFKTALKLSPKRPETLIEWGKTNLVIKDYEGLKEKSQQCLALTEDLPDCYWYIGLAQTFLGDTAQGEKNMQIARQKGLPVRLSYFRQLIQVYMATRNYKGLITTYSDLIAYDPNNFQYHAYLAFLYKEIKNYDMARYETEIVLKLKGDDPEIKKEAEMFLQTLK